MTFADDAPRPDRVEAVEVIVEIGAEGGSLTIVGIRAADGWRFRFVRDESALSDCDKPNPQAYLALQHATYERVLRDGIEPEIAARVYGLANDRQNPVYMAEGYARPNQTPRNLPESASEIPESFHRKWDWVDPWEAALALFDKYPWHKLYLRSIAISDGRFGRQWRNDTARIHVGGLTASTVGAGCVVPKQTDRAMVGDRRFIVWAGSIDG